MTFRITGLPAEPFMPLFDLPDDALGAHDARRLIADDRPPGYPCRISLTDARPGDTMLLVNYEHHAVRSPYRMRFAVFVREGEERFDAVDRVPEQLRSRTLAVRAFDSNAMMIDSRLVEGVQLADSLGRLLSDPRADYIHIHYAAAGCYAACAVRG